MKDVYYLHSPLKTFSIGSDVLQKKEWEVCNFKHHLRAMDSLVVCDETVPQSYMSRFAVYTPHFTRVDDLSIEVAGTGKLK